MKLFKIFILLGLSLLVFACSKNSDSSDDNAEEQEENPGEIDISGNRLASGASGNDILSNDNFERILVEIAYVEGFRPTESAINEFTAYLRNRTFKNDIEVQYLELESPAEDELTLQEIARLETDNRTAYNSGSTLAIYIYFADAPAEGDDLEEGLVTLGAVYRNTSMVIHEVTIRELASRSFIISNADVESATLNHEFGHLFGLVNLGTPMVNNHESESENDDGELVPNKHCNVDGCLMQAELQFGGPSGKTTQSINSVAYRSGMKPGCVVSGNSILNLLNTKTAKGAAAVDLDAECIRDLQANGGR